MILSGVSNGSFILRETGRLGNRVHLEPRFADQGLEDRDTLAGDAVGQPRPWVPSEVRAAAEWFATIQPGNIVDDDFVWFGGGIGFARADHGDDVDVAIDVIILDSPDAPHPSMEDAQHGAGAAHYYGTVVLQFDEIQDAARWWQSLTG